VITVWLSIVNLKFVCRSKSLKNRPVSQISVHQVRNFFRLTHPNHHYPRILLPPSPLSPCKPTGYCFCECVWDSSFVIWRPPRWSHTVFLNTKSQEKFFCLIYYRQSWIRQIIIHLMQCIKTLDQRSTAKKQIWFISVLTLPKQMLRHISLFSFTDPTCDNFVSVPIDTKSDILYQSGQIQKWHFCISPDWYKGWTNSKKI
jgi:hypothetical protein